MFRVSCGSSLHNGFDEPEILRYENLRPVPQALTSDKVSRRMNQLHRCADLAGTPSVKNHDPVRQRHGLDPIMSDAVPPRLAGAISWIAISAFHRGRCGGYMITVVGTAGVASRDVSDEGQWTCMETPARIAA
jgi:hypothetical protein